MGASFTNAACISPILIKRNTKQIQLKIPNFIQDLLRIKPIFTPVEEMSQLVERR